MKRFILNISPLTLAIMQLVAWSMIGVFLLSIAVKGQTVSPTPQKVLVEQSFVDDAAKAFALVVSLRDALQKEQMSNGASAVTKAALQAQIDALNSLIVIQDRKAAIYDSLLVLRDKAFEVYDKIIKIQADIIDRLSTQLGKGKSGWQKFTAGLAKIAVLLAGVLIGRGAI